VRDEAGGDEVEDEDDEGVIAATAAEMSGFAGLQIDELETGSM
jgi:hypothetical protein